MSGSGDHGIFHDRLRASALQLLWLGIFFVVLGVAAIAFPVISTLTATLFVGWALLFAGVAVFVGSFWIHGTGPFFGTNLAGLLSAAAGVFLVFNPLAGAVALTLILAVLFLFQGASELVFALHIRPYGGWVAVLVSAIASIALAVIIISGWQGVSLIVLGLLLGINFITSGAGYIFAARAFKA